jgi:hypothetical protein
MLAEAVGVDGMDRDLCDRMYNARSDWVHGSPVALFTRLPERGPETDEQREVLKGVAHLQDTLRAAVRRCIEDEACPRDLASQANRKAHAESEAVRRGVCRCGRRLAQALATGTSPGAA